MIVYRELYCRDCDKIIGRYNAKYYTEARVGEVVNLCHTGHVKLGHDVEQRRVVVEAGAAGSGGRIRRLPSRAKSQPPARAAP